MRLKVGNLVRQSMLGLAITQLAVMQVFAAGDIAGPGNSTGEYKDDGASGTASGAPYYYNKTIEDAYGSTFEYGNRDSGFGTFTMGNHDTTLIAQWDQIHYAVTFDATAALEGMKEVKVDTNGDGVKDTVVEVPKGDLCNTKTVQFHHVPKENGGVPYYRWYDVMDAANKTKFIGQYDADGNYTAGSGTVKQYTNINVPGGDPFGFLEATGTLEYNLRYDQVYQLFDNGRNESAIFQKIGYDLIGWSTRQPQTYEEMQEMAKWNVVGVDDVFDGANCPRISASDPQAGANTDGTVADLKIGNANVLLADGGKFKNLSWGLPNEYVNDTYQKVTLYAIWAPKQVTSKVYYTLQKEDGTYSLDTSDNANVLLADRSYSVIPTDTVADVVEEIANTGQFNGTWKTDGSTWTRRAIDDSRVYKYDGDTFHDLSYSVIDVQQTIYQTIPGEDQTLDGNANTVDKGSFFLDTTDQTIYIKVPRRKVEMFVYGMLQKNSNGYFYTQSKLKTDDGELFGTFSVKAKNASAYVETRDNPTPTQIDLADSTLRNVYQMTLTAYAGQTVDITNVLENGKQTLGEYTYSYLGNSYGNGEFNQSYQTEGPKQTSRDIKITVGTGSMYVLLYFNKEEAPAKPLEVKWNEMTRNYHDPYGIGVDGAGYGGVQNATGPWQNIQWKSAEVGTGQSSRKIYYMQIWLDNNASGADKRDRLNIQAMPSGGKLELHQMYNNKDLVVVRFESGITEAVLQSWLRNQFAVIQYTDPGAYTPADDRVKIFVTDVQGYNRNDTGEKTIYVDPGYVTVNNFYVPQSFEDGAHLMFDGQGPNGAILYWKYKYRERQQVQTGPEGHISAGDRGGHNYSENPWDYAHASYTMGIPSWITNKPGLQWAKQIRARADAYTFDTIDNKIIVAIDGTYVVWDGSNGRKHWDAGWTGTAGGHQVTFDLWAGDQSEANTGTAYNEDHGGELENMTVIWEYEVLIQKFSVIKFREDASVNTTEYTIPTQYPVVIQYNGQTAWKQDAGNTSDVYWSEVPGDNVNGFDNNWIFGMYSTDGGHDLNNNAAGSPEKYTKNLSTNVLRRYGYVWDGHWYTVYDGSKIQKNAYDWLTNRLSGVKGGQTWNAGNNKLNLLKYNTQFGNISNPSGTYSYQRAGTYGNFYTMQESNIKYRFNSKGYVPITTNEKSNGTAVTLDYQSMIQLWLQSGAEYRQYNINDRYTGNQTKSIPCRVITLYAARTVPVQYTVKYVSGGTSTFGDNTVPYSWDTDKSLQKGSINNTNSATQSNSDLAKSHALNAPASGVDTQSTNYGNWYRQQFVYDTPSKLSKVAFSRNDGDLTIDGESLDGYKFIGWTVYKDETGNNDSASYRKNDTKNSDKELMDTVDIKVNTKQTSYVDNGTQMKSGTASQLVTIQNSTKKWNGAGASGEVEEYRVTENNNEFFLADQANVENLLGVVQTSGDIGEVTKNGWNVQIPRVVYSDNFKWPEVVVYPNWLKEVNLTIDVDPKDDVEPGDSGKFGDQTTLIEQKVAYGNDVMYNNTLYYPINLDRVFNNIDTLKKDTIDKGESWRGSFGFIKGDRESGNLAGTPTGNNWNTWKDANGSNEIWNKTAVSTVKDKDSQLINTDYRFLGLQFSNKTTYPTSSNDISETIQNGSVRLPDGAITVGENEKALIDNGDDYKFYTHPRKYALQAYDTDQIKLDADGYNNILTKFFDDNRDKAGPYVGVDNSEGYLSTIDCYNNTTLYAVWEPIMTTQVDVNRTGYPSIKIGYPEKDRITGVEEFYVEIPSKSGTGMQIITGIDGNKPKDTADDKELWDTSDSYRTTLEYRYNDPFTEEIVNLYKDPIASDKDFQTVLDKLNNQATWTANQRDDGTPQTPKITTPHSYQSWSFYLPLYLGTDEMNEASHGRFVFSPSKVYEVDIISSRYSYYYQNYVPDSEKDDKYPDNETVIVRLGYKLEEANKPDHQDPDLNPTPTPNPGGPTPTPSPSPTPDPGGPGGPTPTPSPDPGPGGSTPTPSPSPTPTPSYPPDNPGGGNDGQSVLDDLRVHVQLH